MDLLTQYIFYTYLYVYIIYMIQHIVTILTPLILK